MEFLKKKWYLIVIVLLLLFGMNKCASSCTNSNMYEDAQKEHTEYVHKSDSIVKVYDDSVKTLNSRIQVLEATINGNQEMINRLAAANEQISNAKKNINVNVRK